MPDFTKRVVKGIGGDLQPGEQVLKALAGQPPGSFTRGMNEGMSVAGGLARGRTEKARHAAEVTGEAAAVPPRNVFVTLTDRRVLLHTMTKLGSPEDLVADLAFDRIAAIEFTPRRFGNGDLRIVFADGSDVDLLIVQRQKPERFMEAWTARSQ